MGAKLAPAGPSRPREDDRAGEARVLSPPSPADGGAASDEASGAPFSFFAAGTGLAKKYRRQASTMKQEAKRESSTYSSSLAGSSNLRPNLKPESRMMGSTSRGSGAGGASAVRLGTGADPRGTSPVLLRNQGQALATQLVAVLVVIRHEAKSVGPTPREGLSRLPVGRL